MYLGRVAGCVWATVKDAALEGQRMLVIQPLTPDLRETGKRVVCTDCTGAGAGEIVYFTRGKEASFPFLPKEVPTDMTVVGIVDSIHVAPSIAGEARTLQSLATGSLTAAPQSGAGLPACAVPLPETTAQARRPTPLTSRSKAPKC